MAAELLMKKHPQLIIKKENGLVTQGKIFGVKFMHGEYQEEDNNWIWSYLTMHAWYQMRLGLFEGLVKDLNRNLDKKSGLRLQWGCHQAGLFVPSSWTWVFFLFVRCVFETQWNHWQETNLIRDHPSWTDWGFHAYSSFHCCRTASLPPTPCSLPVILAP